MSEAKTTKQAAKQKAPDPLRAVVGWIVNGHSEADVIDAIEKEFPRTKARPLIIEAMQELAIAADVDPDVILGFAVEGTREVYRRAIEMGDLQTGLRALKQLRDLTKA